MRKAKRKPTHRKHHPLHEYKSRCIYHITLVVSDRVPLFGRMVGATVEEARVEHTELGFAISEEIQAIPSRCAKKGRQVKILAKVVMPEHIHFVLFVEQPMDVKLHMVIRGFKQGCNKRLRFWLEKAGGTAGGMTAGGMTAGGGTAGGMTAGVGNTALPDGGSPTAATNDQVDGSSATATTNDQVDGSSATATTNDQVDGSSATATADNPTAIADSQVNGGSPTAIADSQADGGSQADGSSATALQHEGTLRVFPSGSDAFSRPSQNVNSHQTEAFLRPSQSALPPKEAAFLRQLSSCGSARILSEHALFEEDFDETRLRRQGQLKNMISYVHNNPRHRWLKQHKPEWLCVTRGIVIAGRTYDAIGNVNLLALPRHQVHCRYKWERDHDLEARRNHQNECVIKARQNYALVSPFVSPHEAAVRDFCLEEGHSVIVLHNNGFTDFSQCPGGLYDYCVMGQVLVLVPSDWPHDDRKGVCTRQECVALNGYAEEIVNER